MAARDLGHSRKPKKKGGGDKTSDSDAVLARRTRWATKYCYEFADKGKCSKGDKCTFSKEEHISEKKAKERAGGKKAKGKGKGRGRRAAVARTGDIDDADSDVGLGSDVENDSEAQE